MLLHHFIFHYFYANIYDASYREQRKEKKNRTRWMDFRFEFKILSSTKRTRWPTDNLTDLDLADHR